MNFFKSILSEDPDPPAPGKAHGFGPASLRNASDGSEADEESDAKPNPPAGGGWSFGGLIQTLASRSESVIETYRRDLEEFGSGLRKETETLRDVASRAAKELPASIEVGASKAHGSLESVIKSTAGIISQGLETAAGSISDAEPDTPESNRKLSSAKYSRFDAQLNAIQSDRSTFCEEPEDLNDFRNWKLGFVLEEKAEEMSNLIGEDGALEAVHSKVVPRMVDDEIFWCRYFYRVHKLKQQESVRVNLVKRAISADDEEELSWDVDDEDETSLKGSLPPESSTRDDSQTQSSTASANDDPTIDDHEEGAEMEENMLKVVKRDEEKASSVDAAKVDHVESGKDSKDSDVSKASSVDAAKVDHVESGKDSKDSDVSKASSVDAAKVDHVESSKDGKDSDVSKASSVDAAKVDHVESGKDSKDSDLSKARSVDAAKVDHVESGKDSKANDVLSQKSANEDRDLDWDEIEDIGSGDEKRASPITHGGSPSPADLKKRLSTATTAEEEDEELTWDIEDED